MSGGNNRSKPTVTQRSFLNLDQTKKPGQCFLAGLFPDFSASGDFADDHMPYFCFRIFRRLIFQRRSRFCLVVSFSRFITRPSWEMNSWQPAMAGSIEPDKITGWPTFGKRVSSRLEWQSVNSRCETRRLTGHQPGMIAMSRNRHFPHWLP
jgi:hypothetical protein